MQTLVDLIERHLGVAWSDIVEWLQKNNSLDDIEARLKAHDIDGVIAELDTAAAHFAAAVHDGYIEAGQQQAEWLANETDSLVRFDIANHRAVNWARDNAATMVRQVSQDQKDMLRSVIVDGVQAGDNPREVARTIRESIGLTDTQAAAVQSYRDALENQDYANALGRQLSHGHSDTTIAAAQRAGREMSADQIDLAVERYRQNAITARAETISRTEALRAAHQGSHEALRQATERGDVPADSLTRQWHHTSAGRHPRREHAQMDRQVRGLDEPFTSGSGASLMYPGDPDAPPEDTINCRCAVATRLSL